MKKYSASFFLLSLFILGLHFAHAQTSVKLPYKEKVENRASDTRYYSLDLSNIPENMSLALKSMSTGTGSSTAKIFVSKSNTKPSSTKDADYYSTNQNGNVIFIARDDLKDVKNLYIGIQCSTSKCSSHLTFEYSKELFMEANGDRQIETSSSLGAASSAIIRLKIPKIDNADRIVIHIDALPSSSDQTPVLNVFFNQGSGIPYTGRTEDVKRTSWFEGRTIVLSKGTPLFCTDCDYTLSLEFNEGASISFEARVFQTETELGGYAMLDGVGLNRGNSYTLTIQEDRKEEDIVIDLRPQEGSPIVYLNCDTKPGDITGYYWKYHIDKSQEIVVTARERTQCKTNKMYVLVYGDEVSVYSLRAVVKKASKLFVGKDTQVLGDIFPNEKITYEIFMPLFAADKIVIKLDTKGKVDANIINCRFPTDCPGLLPSDMEYKHPDSEDFINYNLDEFKYDTQTTKSGKNFIIDPHASGCYPILIEDPIYMEDALPVCAYQITLSSTESFPQEYTLTADSEGHQWLFPSIPKSGSVVEKEKEYFVVYVPPHKDVKSVNFQLTEFSGDVVIYISQKEKYPDEKSDDTRFAHEGMIMFTNSSELSGTYYVTIEGLTTSSFGITVNVIGKGGEEEDYALTLEPGVPQKGVLLPNQEHPAQFYKFKLNVDDKWKGSIKISVSTLRGNVLVGVNNNGQMPLPNIHTWKSYGRDLEITSEDPSFKAKATYHIGVFVDWSKLKLGDIVFTISYSLKGEGDGTGKVDPYQQHQFLSPLTPYFGTLKKGQIEYFEAFVLPRDKKITIYKQADVGDVDIFLTTDPNVPYPSVNSYTYTTMNTFRDYIELNEKDFKKICANEEDSICSFYFSVTPKGDQQDVPFSLTMYRDYKQSEEVTTWIPLEDGRQTKLDVPATGPSNFYFYTTPYNPGVVTVTCPGKVISIYASKTKIDVGSSAKPEVKAVTSEAYEYSSFEHGTSSVGLASLTIPAYENEDTNIVSVAVYFWDVDTPSPDNSRFSILASTEMTYIFTGRPYYGSVQEGKYMYFFFDVYKDSTTLLVSLTTLDDGDPDLVVSTGYDSRPTIDQHQFASISLQRTELLEINDLDIYPLNSMANTWVIGVYGRKASKFTLTVLYEDQKTVELTSGQPFEMFMRESSVMYFKYYQSKTSDLEIKVDKISGSIEAYVSTMKGDGDLVSNLPNATYNSWNFIPDYGAFLNISATDPKSCSNCVYLIALKSNDASKLSITVTEGNKFAQIQNGMTYSGVLSGGAMKRYSFSSSKIDEVVLSLSMIGSRLDVFVSHNPTVNETEKFHVWKAELTPSSPSSVLSLKQSDYDAYLKRYDQFKKSIFNGKKEVPSESNTFYVLFYNPFFSNVNYSFTMAAKDSSTVMKHGYKHPLTISGNGGVGSLLYYSSEEEEIIKIVIEFSVTRNISIGYDPDFERNIKRGLPLSVYYWSEKSTAGLGQQVALFKDYVMLDSISDVGDNSDFRKYKIREAFTTSSKRGKFNLEIENPFSQPAEVQVTAYSTEYGTLTLEQNSQFSSSLSKGMSETFEVYLTNKGAWYFFVHSCSGNLDFSMEDNPEKLAQGSVNTNEIGRATSLMRQTDIKKSTTKYVRIGRSESTQDKITQFTLSSSFFEEEKLYNYELRSSIPSISTRYVFGPHNSIITVNVPPVQVQEAHNDDDVIYRVKACPIDDNDLEAIHNYCKVYENCKTVEMQSKLSRQNTFNANIERLQPGNYYVQATAEIQHRGKMVRFAAYPVEIVKIEKSIMTKLSEMIGTILLVLGVLFIGGFICFKCYGKFKTVVGEERGFELPSFGKSRKYDFLGDDL